MNDDDVSKWKAGADDGGTELLGEVPWRCVECRDPLAEGLMGDLKCNSCGERYAFERDCCGGPLIYMLPQDLRHHYQADFANDPRDMGHESTRITELYFRQCEAYIEYAGDRETCLKRMVDHQALATAMVGEYFPALPAIGRPCRFLEIGAGHCSSGAAIVRKLGRETLAYALDFSDVLLKDIAPFVIEGMGVSNEQIVKVVGVFEEIPFADGYFDVVVADASLHHAEDPGVVLAEIYRVLRDGGMLYAQREPFLSQLRSRGQLRRVQQTPDHQGGAVENIYSYHQWKSFFAVAGFAPVELVPVGILAVHKMTRYRGVGRLYNQLFRRPLWRRWALGRMVHGIVNRLAVPAFVILAHKPDVEET